MIEVDREQLNECAETYRQTDVKADDEWHDAPVCPYCGCHLDTSELDIDEGGEEIFCPSCDREIHVACRTEYRYKTSPLNEHETQIRLAKEIALTAFSDVRDAGGNLWSVHLATVARTAEVYAQAGANSSEQWLFKCVAWLMDVLDDTDIDEDTLRTLGICDEVVDTLTWMRRMDGETRRQRVWRIANAAQPGGTTSFMIVARNVLLSSTVDDMDASRLNRILTQSDVCMLNRNRHYLNILTDSLDKDAWYINAIRRNRR